MKKWLESLRQRLNQKFNKEEVEEVIAYYEELINDRLDHGEQLEDILNSFHIHEIEKDMFVNQLSKRENLSLKDLIKTMTQFFIVLITTPLWIPIAVLYFVFYILVAVFFIVSFSLVFSGFIAGIYYIGLGLITYQGVFELMGQIGLGLITTVVLCLVGLLFYKLSIWIAKYVITVFTKLVKKMRGVR